MAINNKLRYFILTGEPGEVILFFIDDYNIGADSVVYKLRDWFSFHEKDQEKDVGVGKTTLVQKISSSAQNSGMNVVGFYTEEVRRNRVREGFDIITLEGERGHLARDQSLLKVPVKYKVGKYGVLIQEFEKIALPCLSKADESHLLVIDEIGKMELFSESFKSKIRDIFSDKSKYTVLATIPIRKGDLLIESIRNNRDAKVWTITRDNRNNIQEEIFKEIKTALSFD